MPAQVVSPSRAETELGEFKGGQALIRELAKSDPLLSFILDLRDGIERETAHRLYPILKPAQEAAFDAMDKLKGLVDPHKPNEVLAALKAIYMIEFQSAPPEPDPKLAAMNLEMTAEQYQTLEGLKRLIDPHKPESIQALAERYMQMVKAEGA